MASLVINSITLSCIVEDPFQTSIEYRISGGGAYTNAGVANTNPDGTFVTPFVINGLAEDTCYDIRFSISSSVDAICPYVEGFCIGAGTTTTTTSTTTTSTTTTTTSSTTTTTTTISFCMGQGFPAGDVYAALYWADSYTDTTTTEDCEGNPYSLPSESRAVWIAFYSDASLTTPIVTSLNSYPIVVNGSPVFIGDGTPQIAYFVGVYPYFWTNFTGFLCETESGYYDLPTLNDASCFDLPPVLGEVPSPAEGTIQRGSGDSTAYGFYWDFRNSIFEAGQSYGGTLSAAVGAGSTGPYTNSNLPVYGNITVGCDTSWGGLFQKVIVTISGTANDGSSGEVLEFFGPLGGTGDSTKRYFADANHPITITFDIEPV